MAYSLSDYGDIVSPKDVKNILGLGWNKTYELLSTKKIKNFRVGKSIKIPKKYIEEYINNESAK